MDAWRYDEAHWAASSGCPDNNSGDTLDTCQPGIYGGGRSCQSLCTLTMSGRGRLGNSTVAAFVYLLPEDFAMDTTRIGVTLTRSRWPHLYGGLYLEAMGGNL